MLEHMKTHHTNKAALKSKLKEDLLALKKKLVKKFDEDDFDFIKEIQGEFEEILQAHEKTISSDQVFKELTNKYTKAGTLLRGLRVREGLTQEQFAEIIEVTQANLSSMENGKRPIGKSKAKLIAEKFDIDYRYLL